MAGAAAVLTIVTVVWFTVIRDMPEPPTEQPKTMAELLVGTWKLVSIEGLPLCPGCGNTGRVHFGWQVLLYQQEQQARGSRKGLAHTPYMGISSGVMFDANASEPGEIWEGEDRVGERL
jgi:hypothetical protein